MVISKKMVVDKFDFCDGTVLLLDIYNEEVMKNTRHLLEELISIPLMDDVYDGFVFAFIPHKCQIGYVVASDLLITKAAAKSLFEYIQSGWHPYVEAHIDF